MSGTYDRSSAADWMRGGLPYGHPLAFLSAWSFARFIDVEAGALYKPLYFATRPGVRR